VLYPSSAPMEGKERASTDPVCKANPGAACDGAGRTFQRARHGSRHRPGDGGGDLLCARGAADKAVEVGAGGDVAGGERRDPDA